ncbi:MAG: hypothetical protein IKK96_01505, partial [Lachnospiraceae bacterium]|nr:hypothetical protein [Lachnospiraceae bacterium]
MIKRVSKALLLMMSFLLCMGCFFGCGTRKKEIALMENIVKIEVDEKKYLVTDLGFSEDCTYSYKGEGIAIYNGILRGMVSDTVTKVYVDDKDG